jgi:predicted XRE-type DNA-binding protein
MKKSEKIDEQLRKQIGAKIAEILQKKGLKQAYLAEKWNGNPPEVSRVIAGKINLTVKSIAEIQAILGEPIITIP